jgi:hypothetical protein
MYYLRALGLQREENKRFTFGVFCFPHLTSEGFPQCQVCGVIYFDFPVAEVSSIETFNRPLFKLFSAVL